MTVPTFKDKDERDYAGSVPNITFVFSGTPAENDILLISVYKENRGAFTAPAGFTEIYQGNDSTGNFRAGLWWKRAGASETNSYAVTWTRSTPACGTAVSYSGCKTTGSPINTSSQNTNTGATRTATGITTTADDCRVITWFHEYDWPSSITSPTGNTVRAEANAPGLGTYEFIDDKLVSATFGFDMP